ncbi:MAG TPA: hypothetical protein PKI69_10605 [Rhodocyclaceae bacterium]|nr:hypothetical protein [Rhodocyclaceae bacterium]
MPANSSGPHHRINARHAVNLGKNPFCGCDSVESDPRLTRLAPDEGDGRVPHLFRTEHIERLLNRRARSL